MALLTDGIDDTIASSTALTLGAPGAITVAFWMWWDTLGTNDDLAFELGDSGVSGSMYINPNYSGAANTVSVAKNKDSLNATLRKFSRLNLSAATWTHWCVKLDMDTGANDSLFFNGVSQTLNSSDVTGNTAGGTFADLVAHFMSRSNTLFGAGRIADAGIWAVLLTADEIVSLAKGFDPRLVRPQSLKFYNPIQGRRSPEPGFVGPGLTISGAVNTDHPRILRPAPVLQGV